MIVDGEGLAWLARRDGTVVIGHGPFVSSEVPPLEGVAFLKRGFLANKRTPWKIPSKIERLSVSDFHGRFSGRTKPVIRWETPDAIPFSVVFQEITERIRSGAIEKTVPVVTERGLASEPPGPGILSAMASQSTPLYSYGWIAEDSGFAGATPELLLSLRGNELETMALAGTAREEDEAVFGVDEKEIREHEYVAQTLVAKLLDHGKLRRREREILRLGSIVHFHTAISVTLSEQQTPGGLVSRLHPTPALGPLPRTGETMEMLGEWRQRLGCPDEFGAPFGVWDEGTFEAVVAIRGLWWNGLEISLPAGCGIIEASRLVNEWRELRLKRESVKAFL